MHTQEHDKTADQEFSVSSPGIPSGQTHGANSDLQKEKSQRKWSANAKQRPLSQWFSPKSGSSTTPNAIVHAPMPGTDMSANVSGGM
eukprot:5468970-Karenia_brevis.AAC.1